MILQLDLAIWWHNIGTLIINGPVKTRSLDRGNRPPSAKERQKQLLVICKLG